MKQTIEGRLANRTFTVRVGELRASLLFASNDETRFVLNGVHVEARAGKPPLLVSTDGRRLAAIESIADQGDEPAEVDFQLTLASSFLKPLCAFAKSQTQELLFDYRPTDRVLCHFVGGKTFLDCEQGAVVQGTYPNWRQCVPTGEKSSVPHIGVNAEYVGDFAKAAKVMAIDSPIISVNLIGATTAMDVRIEAWPSFYGVLMPAKILEDKEWQPEFVGMLDQIEPVDVKSGSEEAA